MKRFQMEFVLPEEGIESVEELGFYIWELGDQLLERLRTLPDEIWVSWLEGKFAMTRSNDTESEILFLARITSSCSLTKENIMLRFPL